MNDEMLMFVYCENVDFTDQKKRLSVLDVRERLWAQSVMSMGSAPDPAPVLK